MKKNKKNFSNLFSSYPFLSPIGWSLKNKDQKGVFLSISVWFVSIAFVFFVTYFAWFIDEIPLERLRTYIRSGRYLPVLIMTISVYSRLYAYNHSKTDEIINNKLKLYYLRTIVFFKYLLLVLTIPLINSVATKIDSRIINGLTRISQEDAFDLIIKTVLGQ